MQTRGGRSDLRAPSPRRSMTRQRGQGRRAMRAPLYRSLATRNHPCRARRRGSPARSRRASRAAWSWSRRDLGDRVHPQVAERPAPEVEHRWAGRETLVAVQRGGLTTVQWSVGRHSAHAIHSVTRRTRRGEVARVMRSLTMPSRRERSRAQALWRPSALHAGGGLRRVSADCEAPPFALGERGGRPPVRGRAYRRGAMRRLLVAELRRG